MTSSCFQARQLWFTAPEQVELRSVQLPAPAADELLVKTVCSAVSAGTELLIYHGLVPADMSADSHLASLVGDSESLQYPLQYGYACVGEVVAVGSNVDRSWAGRRVFSFQPHVSHFLANASQLIPVPDDIDAESAVFLANMETAVNLVQDGAPLLGERVAVLGQGVVGLLLCGVLSRFPLAALYSVDALEARRQVSLHMGAHASFDPQADLQRAADVDLIYEVSGVPQALNLAISLSGFDSRIVVGSWYGEKSAAIALGGRIHRNRVRIQTSQVSTLAPLLQGRWDKARRFETAWEMIRQLQPGRLVSHRSALSDADALYRSLDKGLQALFVY